MSINTNNHEKEEIVQMKLILTYFLISSNGYDWDFLQNNYSAADDWKIR